MAAASLGLLAWPTTSIPCADKDIANPVITIGWSSASITRIGFCSFCTFDSPGSLLPGESSETIIPYNSSGREATFNDFPTDAGKHGTQVELHLATKTLY
jgi:hypothetical protein